MSTFVERSVRVELRRLRLADATTLTDLGDDGVFVALDEPPPVKSVLTIHQGADSYAVEVIKVVEVAEADPRGCRGVYAKRLDAVAPEEQPVGTEALGPGEANAYAGESDGNGNGHDIHGGAAGSGNGSAFAVPSPVVEPEPSEAIALDDAYESEANRKGRKRE